MIDLKHTVLGGPEIGKRLADADSGLRDAIRGELAEVGEEIVSRAQQNAPKRTGIMASKIIWFFGERKRVRLGERTSKAGKAYGVFRTRAVEAVNEPKIEMSVMPTGSVAHLMERGVNATRKAHPRRVTRTNVTVWTRRGQRTYKKLKGQAMVRAHQMTLAPRPFFMPAVDSVGGASGVNARLQAAIDKVAAKGSR